MGEFGWSQSALHQRQSFGGDKEKENGAGVLFIQHFSAINPISTFRNAKAAARPDCLKQSSQYRVLYETEPRN